MAANIASAVYPETDKAANVCSLVSKVGDCDESDPLTVPAKSTSKPRVRRRRLCELSDSEIWRCVHCGKCYSKTSKAAILEHSRSSCQRKIAEDAEIKRQIEQYFRYTPNAGKFHMGMGVGVGGVGMGMNINLSMQPYPLAHINGRMNNAANGMYNGYTYAPTPAHAGQSMPMYARLPANGLNAYSQGLLINQNAAAHYPNTASLDDSHASMYAAACASQQLDGDTQSQMQQLTVGGVKQSVSGQYATAPLSSRPLSSMYDMAPLPLTSASSDSASSVSSQSANQSLTNGVHCGNDVQSIPSHALTANQKMSTSQINQMNFITPAHASRTIQSVSGEVMLEGSPAAAASHSSLSSTSNGAANNSNCQLAPPDSPDDDSLQSTQPPTKRPRLTAHSKVNANGTATGYGQNIVSPQAHHPITHVYALNATHTPAANSYADYDYANPQAPAHAAYSYARQTLPARMTNARPLLCTAAVAGGPSVSVPMSSAVQHPVAIPNSNCNDGALAIHNYRPELTVHNAAASAGVALSHANCSNGVSASSISGSNTFSVSSADATGPQYSMLQARAPLVPAYSRMSIRPELLHNASTQWQHCP